MSNRQHALAALRQEAENLATARNNLARSQRLHEMTGVGFDAVLLNTAAEHSAFHRWLRASNAAFLQHH